MALTVRYDSRRLRRIMHEDQITQQQLGSQIGRSQSHIARLCRGEWPPSLRLAHLIAAALGRTVDDVFPPDPSWFKDTQGNALRVGGDE